MPSNIAKPHDRFVRRALADLDLARAFFRFFLEKDLQKALDLDGLDGAKETYVGVELDELITDLLYTAPFRDGTFMISLLVEHKSQGAVRGDDHILPFQMRRQEIRIMEHGWRNNERRLYPPVYMIGLYHGDIPYSGPMSVGERIHAPDAWIPQRWRDDMFLVDLSQYSDSDLLCGGKLGVFLLVLKHIYDPDMLTTLEKLIPSMQDVESLKNGADFLTVVFRYLYEASRIKNKRDLDQIAVKSFTEATGGRVMTIAEQIKKENSEQIALRMVEDDIAIPTIVRYTGLSEDAVEKLRQEHSRASA